MTQRRTFGRPFNADIEVYAECKYTASEEALNNSKKVSYQNIISFDIVDGEDAEAIEAETDWSCIDDYHEYLVLHFENSETSTFRNSYVDMFRTGWGTANA